ncbi:GOLPH3/VPS74 family protein [Thalassiella azotivora]
MSTSPPTGDPVRHPLLLAEELLLLLLDEHTGRPLVDGSRLDPALAGAVLAELALGGHVVVSDGTQHGADGGPLPVGRLLTTGAPAPADPLLGEALARVAHRSGRKPQDALGPLARGLREGLLNRLTAAGIVQEREGRVLGLFRTRAWPETDPHPEQRVRHRLRWVVLGGHPGDPRTTALVGLLAAVDALHKVVPDGDRKAVARRAKDLTSADWAPAAVRKAVEEVDAAVMATVIVAGTVAATTAT